MKLNRHGYICAMMYLWLRFIRASELTMDRILVCDIKKFDCKLCETQLLCKFDEKCLVVYKLGGKSICGKCEKLFSILDGLWKNMFRCIEEAFIADRETSGKVRGGTHASDLDNSNTEMSDIIAGGSCAGDTVTEDTDGVIKYDLIIGDIHAGEESIEEIYSGDISTADTVVGQMITTITEETHIGEKVTGDLHTDETLTTDDTLPGDRHTGDTLITEKTCEDDRVTGERDTGDAIAAAEGGTQKFVCDVCGKCFSHGHSLREHVAIHTSMKKFQCHYCGKWFAFKSNYLRHISTKGCKNDFESGICGQFFLSPAIVKQLIVAHKNQKLLVTHMSEPHPICTHKEKKITEDTHTDDTDTGKGVAVTRDVCTGVTSPGETLAGDCHVGDAHNMDETDHLTQLTLTSTAEDKFQCDDSETWVTAKKQLIGHIHIQECKEKLESGKDGTVLVSQASSSDCMVVHQGEDKLVRHLGDTVTGDTHTGDTVTGGTHTSDTYQGKTSKIHCNERWKLFDSDSSLESHTVKHIEASKSECYKCKKFFFDKSNLTQHLLTHLSEKTYQCLYCGKQFDERKTLIQHARTGMCQEKFESGQLGPLFISQSALEQLMVAHEHVNSLTLTDDSVTDMDEQKVNVHTDEMEVKAHRNEKAKIQTGEKRVKTKSRKIMVTRDSDELSVMTASGERRFGCVKCGKLFSKKQHRNAHMERLHLHPRGKREKNIQCDCCGKFFSSNYGLRTHKKTVKGEMKFECETCGKKFVHRGHLNYHILTHTGERAFVCEYCGKSYRQSGALNMHIKKHKGLKDYPCGHCEKGFYTKHDREIHIQRMHGARPGRKRRQIT